MGEKRATKHPAQIWMLNRLVLRVVMVVLEFKACLRLALKVLGVKVNDTPGGESWLFGDLAESMPGVGYPWSEGGQNYTSVTSPR